MTRQLMVGLLTLMLTAPAIADTEEGPGGWWTSSFPSETDGGKTCEAGTRLALGEPGSDPLAAVLMVSYSSALGSTPKLVLVFVGDRPVSRSIRVRFDAGPSFTPSTVNDDAMVIFSEPSSILQHVRTAMAMKVNLKLLYHDRTTMTFSLRGSAKAIASAKAACSQGE